MELYLHPLPYSTMAWCLIKHLYLYVSPIPGSQRYTFSSGFSIQLLYEFLISPDRAAVSHPSHSNNTWWSSSLCNFLYPIRASYSQALIYILSWHDDQVSPKKGKITIIRVYFCRQITNKQTTANIRWTYATSRSCSTWFSIDVP